MERNHLRFFRALFLCTAFSAFVSLCTLRPAAAGYRYKLKTDADTVLPASYLARAKESGKLRADLSGLTEEAYGTEEKKELPPMEKYLGIHTTEDKEYLDELCALGIVEFFEEDTGECAELFDMPSPSDFANLAPSYNIMSLSPVWKCGISGKAIRVGVIDSGVSPHEVFGDSGKLLPGKCFLTTAVDADGDPVADGRYDSGSGSTSGHGTKVAGIIAGKKPSRYFGVAYDAEIVPLKVYSDVREGSSEKSGTVDEITNAIAAAVHECGCRVINMSLGFGKSSDALRSAVDDAVANGVVIVSAAGNDKNTSYRYPAAYDNVIGVSAVDEYGVWCSFSNQNNKVDVAAHGGNSVFLVSASSYSTYSTARGTSFACPIVSGVVACMLSARPDLTPARVKSILCETAVDAGEEGYDDRYGYGIVNCSGALSRLLAGVNWRSGFLEYNGTTNIAFRRGIPDTALDTSVYFAEYDENGKMTSLSGGAVSEELGEITVLSRPSGSDYATFVLETSTLSPKSLSPESPSPTEN